MGYAMLALTVINGIMSYNAQKEQGKEAMRQAKASKAMSDYQARLSFLRAGIVEKQGAVEQRTSDIMFGQKLGAARTMIASNGVLLGAGSSRDYEMDAVTQHAIEKTIIAQNTATGVWAHLADASTHKMNGAAALQGGVFAKNAANSNAVGSLLGTAGSVGMQAYSMGGKSTSSPLGGSTSSFGKTPSLIGDANSFGSGQESLGINGSSMNNIYRSGW